MMKKSLICCFLLICSIAVLVAEETAEAIMKGAPSKITIGNSAQRYDNGGTVG